MNGTRETIKMTLAFTVVCIFITHDRIRIRFAFTKHVKMTSQYEGMAVLVRNLSKNLHNVQFDSLYSTSNPPND